MEYLNTFRLILKDQTTKWRQVTLRYCKINKRKRKSKRALSDTHRTGRGQRPEGSSQSQHSPVRLPLPPPAPPPYLRRRAAPWPRGSEGRRAAAHTEQPRSLLTSSPPRLPGSSSPPRSSGAPPAASFPAAVSQPRHWDRAPPVPHSPPSAGAPTAAILSGRGEGRAQARPRRSWDLSGGRAHARERAPPRQRAPVAVGPAPGRFVRHP